MRHEEKLEKEKGRRVSNKEITRFLSLITGEEKKWHVSWRKIEKCYKRGE